MQRILTYFIGHCTADPCFTALDVTKQANLLSIFVISKATEYKPIKQVSCTMISEYSLSKKSNEAKLKLISRF